MSKSNQLTDIIGKSMEALKRTAFIDVIRNRPETTLAEIVEFVEAESMDQVTIGELLDSSIFDAGYTPPETAPAGPGEGKSKKKKKKKPQRVAAKGTAEAPASSGEGEVNTRSKEGRDAYAAEVLACIQKDGARRWSARDVRSEVGGSANQARRALAAHINEGTMSWDGNARATVYFLAV